MHESCGDHDDRYSSIVHGDHGEVGVSGDDGDEGGDEKGFVVRFIAVFWVKLKSLGDKVMVVMGKKVREAATRTWVVMVK